MIGSNKRKKNPKHKNKRPDYSKGSEKKKDLEVTGPFSQAHYSSAEDNMENYVNTNDESIHKDPLEDSSLTLGSVSWNTIKPSKERQNLVSTTTDTPPSVDDSIKKLTDNFKKKRDEFVRNLERDPNYGLKRLDEDNSYDWAAALIGRGQASKRGFFMLPYLQSGHIVCLAVILLCTFVYYPGFYLTELPESTRQVLRKALAVTFSVNGILAVYAGWEAKRRSQPAFLWITKCLFLGGLALNELQENVPLTMKSPKQDSLLPTSIQRKS